MSNAYERPAACGAILFLAVAAVASVASPTVGRADSITYILGIPNASLSSSPPPYGFVNITTNGTDVATVTVTTTPNYVIGGQDALGLNLSIPTVDATESTPTFGPPPGAGFVPSSCANAGCWGSGNEDGFGSFPLQLMMFDGYTNAANFITFTITDTLGAWASAASVLVPNGLGFSVAAHIFPCSAASCSTAAGGTSNATGYAANGVLATPLPGAFALFGSVLFGGLGVSAWRKRRGHRGPVSAFA